MNKLNKKMKEPFGWHLSLDFYDCDKEIIKDINNCYHFLSSVPDIIKTDIQSPPFIVSKKNIGFAGWIPVVESGISLYIDFSTSFVAIDIYTCKKLDYDSLRKFSAELFKPQYIKENRFLRGNEYNNI